MSSDNLDQPIRLRRLSAPGVGFILASIVALVVFVATVGSSNCSGGLCWVQTLFGLMVTAGAWLVVFCVVGGVIALHNRSNKDAIGYEPRDGQR